MLGMGEHEEEIRQTLLDIRAQGCELLTIGQYLQPSARHLPVERYLTPEEFAAWEEEARRVGFRGAESLAASLGG
jgi:lipoic acid synthetase